MHDAARRKLVLSMPGLLLASGARAQPAGRLPRVGIVFNSSPLATMVGDPPSEPVMREFVLGLRELGWVEGRTVSIERRSAEGNLDRLASIVSELARLPVDVIVVNGNAATLAAKNATATVPIVSAGMFTPVELGIVQSLARPGGNVTGSVPAFGQEMGIKRLELLHELAPRAKRIAYFATRVDPGVEIPLDVVAAATSMRLTLVGVDARLPRIEEGLAAVERAHPDAVLAVPTTPLYPHRERIVAFATRLSLPDVHGFREAAEAGGLASYGGDTYAAWRRTARYVDRILRGAKPADLPIEKSDRYWLVLNAKRARALGLAIPPGLRQRADEVIE